MIVIFTNLCSDVLYKCYNKNVNIQFNAHEAFNNVCLCPPWLPHRDLWSCRYYTCTTSAKHTARVLTRTRIQQSSNQYTLYTDWQIKSSTSTKIPRLEDYHTK